MVGWLHDSSNEGKERRINEKNIRVSAALAKESRPVSKTSTCREKENRCDNPLPYIYIYIYIYICACEYIRRLLDMHVCVCLYMSHTAFYPLSLYIHPSTLPQTHRCMYIYSHIYIYLFIRMYVYIYFYIYRRVHTCTYIFCRVLSHVYNTI